MELPSFLWTTSDTQGDVRAQSHLPEIPNCPEYLLYLASVKQWSGCSVATFLYYGPVLLWNKRGRTTPEASAAEVCKPSSALNTKLPAFFSTLLSLLVFICIFATSVYFIVLSGTYSLFSSFICSSSEMSSKGERIPASHVPTLEQLKSLWDASLKTSFSLWEVIFLFEKPPWLITVPFLALCKTVVYMSFYSPVIHILKEFSQAGFVRHGFLALTQLLGIMKSKLFISSSTILIIQK